MRELAMVLAWAAMPAAWAVGAEEPFCTEPARCSDDRFAYAGANDNGPDPTSDPLDCRSFAACR